MGNELFEKAPIPKAYFKMALPVVFGMVISLVYNMVDTYFISQTQNTSLVAGVSLCAPVFTLMIALGDIFGLGGSSVISRLFGEKREEEGKKVSGFCFYSAIVCGIIIAAILLIFQKPILTLLGAGEDTYSYALQYYKYLALGAPFIIVSLTPSNLIRTEGMALEAMIATISGSIANIILDPIFIFVLGMGAGGAAIATVLGNVVTDIILVVFVLKKSKKLTVSFRNIRIDHLEVMDILAIGIPASITNIMQSFGITLTNRYLASYGTEKVASMGIAMKVNMIVVLVMVGFAFGAQPLIGYNYGAKNQDRLKKIIRFDLKVQILFALCSAALLAIFAPGIIHIFMQEQGIVEAGSLILRGLLLSAPFVGVVLVYTTVFQAAGKAMPAFLLSVSRQGVIFAVCIMLMSKAFGYYGVVFAQAAADFLTALLAIALFRKSRLYK